MELQGFFANGVDTVFAKKHKGWINSILFILDELVSSTRSFGGSSIMTEETIFNALVQKLGIKFMLFLFQVFLFRKGSFQGG